MDSEKNNWSSEKGGNIIISPHFETAKYRERDQSIASSIGAATCWGIPPSRPLQLTSSMVLLKGEA